MDTAVVPVPNPLALADWRRAIAELYAAVRADDRADRAWDLWRSRRDELFTSHVMSPVAGDDVRPQYFDYDAAWRFEVETTDEVGDLAPVTMDLGRDGTIRLNPALQTQGLQTTLGRELTIYWIAGYGGGLFLPFKDGSSGTETFGGGRYLLDGIKGADLGTRDGRLVLDFNFAYNPSCSYSERWTCPLSPTENTVPAAIRAGEKTPS